MNSDALLELAYQYLSDMLHPIQEQASIDRHIERINKVIADELAARMLIETPEP